MNDSFSALHPALTFCYFAAVLLLTMLVLHPVFLALSLLGALGYCAVLRGWRSLGRTLGRLVPFLVLMAVLNALFNHAGVTMLFYLPNGNPVTREALCYGAAAAAMFAAVILWFQCCNVVMTAEKYLYVFGSALPGVSLLLSMALRFVPKFSAHIRAVRAAQAVGYTSAGTIEFLLDDKLNYYFMEMNTRIQVEHPVTEMVTGTDLVEEMIRVAAGDPLTFTQDDITYRGHAIECRVNAEQPERGFLPSPGTISQMHLPGGNGVRVDTAAYDGYEITPYYDSMIAKVIVHGRDRTEAIAKMRTALEEMVVVGVKTNLDFQYAIMENETFAAGLADTSFIERFMKGEV